jgi:hypothetical protein
MQEMHIAQVFDVEVRGQETEDGFQHIGRAGVGNNPQPHKYDRNGGNNEGEQAANQFGIP